MHFPNQWSIGHCPPCVAPRLDTPPVPGHLDPTAASRPRPPALCLANPYCCSSTVEAESLLVDKSKRPAFAPEVNRNKARSERQENPTLEVEAWWFPDRL